jgi:molecular chaperone DnaK (HSP70)
MSELLLRLPGMETAAVEQALASRKVINVCSKSFAVKTRDRGSSQYHLEFLILRNSPVPSTQTRRFGTYSANQDRVEIAVYESSTEAREEKDYPRDPNHPAVQHLKSVWLDLPAGLPEGHPIEVTYDLSSDGGRLQVSARDPQSGRSIEDSVALQGAMTEQELREAISRVDEVILS